MYTQSQKYQGGFRGKKYILSEEISTLIQWNSNKIDYTNQGNSQKINIFIQGCSEAINKQKNVQLHTYTYIL